METKGPVTNPGNIKKVIYKGKRFIYEFVTENTGRAYFLVKDEAGDKKGAYAGRFTKVPAFIDSSIPEDSMGEPIKQEETTTVAERPKPVVATKPTVTLKATPRPPPLPAASSYRGYFQKQEGLGCGRHALNNLFGREVFKKGSAADKVSIPPPAEPISLLGICRTVVEILKKKGIREYCSVSENYDVNTIHAATDILGYKTEDFTITKELDETDDFLGFLVNLGLVEGRPKHWISLKFKERQADGTVLYDLFDSLNSGPVEAIPYSFFAAQHPQTYMVKVFLPKGAPINPEERFILMENVVEVPTAKAASITDCSVLYDPCTKKPVKDMAALEARVADIKAKKVVKAGGSRKKTKKVGRKTRKVRR